MPRIKFEYADKSFVIQSYNTQIEKDLLIMDSFENYDLKESLQVLGLTKEEVQDLTLQEQIALMFKFRSISVGEDINIKYKCSNCNEPNDSTVNIDDNIVFPEENIDIKQQFKPVTEDNLQEFVDIDVEELDIDEFEELLNKVKDSVIRFNFEKETTCFKCGQVNRFSFDDPEKILSYMSEDSLISLYQVYNDLSFFGKYTKQDIDSMIPFERTIFIGLLNKTREELNK